MLAHGRSKTRTNCGGCGAGMQALLIALALLTAFTFSPENARGRQPSPPLGPDAALRRVLGHKSLRRAKLSIEIADLSTGTVLFQRGAARKLNPASAAKLITTAAALSHFGSSHRFASTFHGTISRNGDSQALYIRGGGNPATRVRDLWAVVESLKRQGLKRIQRGFVLDLSAFDAQTLPPAFDQKKTDAHYRPSVSAFSVNFSRVTVFVAAGEQGKPARVTTFPRCAYFAIENRSLTVAKKGVRLRVESVRRGTQTVLVISGEISAARRRPIAVRKRVYHPSRLAVSVLRQLLRDAGIKVHGSLQVAPVSPKLPLLATLFSAPLAQIIAEANKTSNNFISEMLLKQLGRTPTTPGSFSAGIDAARTFLVQSVKLSDANLRLVNGSGLYDANRISAAQLGQLLRYMGKHPLHAPEYLSSLSIAGTDGTLRHRLRGNSKHQMRAKTGTLDGISALAGYLRAKSGRTLSFVFLVSGPVVPYHVYRRIQDKLASVAREQY